MRKTWLTLLFLGCLILPLLAASIPEPLGYVVDTIGLLRPETVSLLTQKCKSIEPKGQMAILVVDSTQPLDIRQYGIKVAEKWKVGYKGKDNGIILILAKTDRKVGIETGRETEVIVPDFIAGRIITNSIIPYFKAGKWDEGMLAGADAIVKEMLK